MNWTYVSMINSADSYGDGAASDIQDLLRANPGYGICLATVVRIPTSAVDADYDYVVDKLTADSQARVVLIYLSRINLSGFFSAVRRRVGFGWFVFVGGDPLNPNQNQNFADMLEGSIYTNLPTPSVPGFQQYIWSLTYGQVRSLFIRILFDDYTCNLGLRKMFFRCMECS
jgi:hypothetical protein